MMVIFLADGACLAEFQEICYIQNPFTSNSGFYADINNNDGTYWNWQYPMCTTSNVCMLSRCRQCRLCLLQDYSYTFATTYNYFRCCSLCRCYDQACCLTPPAE